ncbi:2-isopropylmalate synthase [Bacillus wiedmannii]|uniref:homocitrate synthase/isopropylmalate synthase family protein n=1 Tax=Bacillus wiedmannii TaxID=1890302 RepID=UPI00272FB225|nr:2-isopropylmalate synthase [Bacillus wiedmannii]MDP1459668.1 2-isopropylmalate synthase [Bacillus wiedmannii]
MNRDITILDATLREGEQQCDVRFSKKDKITLVHMLEDFGIRLIEVGHPGISREEEAVCREVAAAAKQADILMHARAKQEEVHAAYRAGADWIGIWASINPISLQTKYTNRSKDYVMNQVKQAIEEARDLGMKIRFTIEDASRTTWEDIFYLGNIAYQAGATRISLADTVGIWEPNECATIVKKAVETFPCQIEVHLHNDLGLALANALAAIDAGASVIDATLCGIGERAGIVDLLNLSVLLSQKYNQYFQLKMIPELTQSLQLATGCKVDHWRPIIGKNVFTHTAPYHVKAVNHNVLAYEGIQPEMIGRVRKIQQKRVERKGPRLSKNLRVSKPFVKGASELLYHRDGPGERWVQMDYRTDERASFYVIQRIFCNQHMDGNLEGHVDYHAHHCDSAFVFWGNNIDGTGLICEVEIEGDVQIIESPASVFIPSGFKHKYKYLSGVGTYTNIVLAPNYNSSLLEEDLSKLYIY